MTNIIVIVILAVVIFFAVRSTLGHFKGESSCCGGGTYKARPKKLDHVSATKTFRVEGMTCQHCVNRVTEAVNGIEGASGDVHLKKGIVVVSTDRPVDDSVIVQAIEKAGYTAAPQET